MSLKNWVSRNSPELLLNVLRPLYRAYHRYILGAADSMKLVGPDEIYDEEYYIQRKKDPLRSDAQNVGTAINNYFSPNSVIDFGCAIGAHLEPFYQHGAEIKGIEGHSKAFDHSVVPPEYLEQHDLREAYTSEQSYDLALCFEVAEHIPEKFADVLVETLASSSDIVVMTAATPGQTGTHHVNEQPREYWYGKFDSLGMKYDSEAVKDLCQEITVEKTVWIPENLMVFKR